MKKWLAAISFVGDGSGLYHVVIELENRGGSIATFNFSGVEGASVSLHGATKHTVFYELKFGSESVSVFMGEGEAVDVLAEVTVPE